MVDSDDFLIREVKSELERERMENLWKKYGTYLIAGAVAIVAGVGGYQYYKISALTAAEKSGATYDQALALAADQKYDDAIKDFTAVAKDGASGYSVLSQLQLAATYLDQKKTADALVTFEKAANSGGDALFTDFARLQAASLRLGTADFTEMQNRLNGLISDENPWRFGARELLGLAQLNSGRSEEARKTFEGLLGDRTTPNAMQERIQVLLAQLVAADITAEAAKEDAADASKKDAKAADTTTDKGDAQSAAEAAAEAAPEDAAAKPDLAPNTDGTAKDAQPAKTD